MTFSAITTIWTLFDLVWPWLPSKEVFLSYLWPYLGFTIRAAIQICIMIASIFLTTQVLDSSHRSQCVAYKKEYLEKLKIAKDSNDLKQILSLTEEWFVFTNRMFLGFLIPAIGLFVIKYTIGYFPIPFTGACLIHVTFQIYVLDDFVMVCLQNNKAIRSILMIYLTLTFFNYMLFS